MKINKALVKHETRNMKWMLLYFLLVSIGGILVFSSNLTGEYMEILRNGMTPDRAVNISAVRSVLDTMIAPMGIGVLLMIYLQFKDSKSVEVGNFLKALPISNKEYYITKFIGGLVSITLPVLILIVGVLAIRTSNMSWVSDIQAISVFPELMMKADSAINITAILLMGYMVVISTYAFLFMMQYIVMNITAGLVIGCLVWLSPGFILLSIAQLYGQYMGKGLLFLRHSETRLNLVEMVFNYIEPWAYPLATISVQGPLNGNINYLLDKVYLMYYDGLLVKILIPLVIAIVSAFVGYILSKKSRVEDSDTLISFKWARRTFIAGVTICSALLLGIMSQLFFGLFNQMNFIVLQIIILIGGLIGFFLSRKITMVRTK